MNRIKAKASADGADDADDADEMNIRNIGEEQKQIGPGWAEPALEWFYPVMRGWTG